MYWFNPSTMFIDVAAKLGIISTFENITTVVIVILHLLIQGLATDLKTVPADMVKSRALRTGDGSHKYSKLQQEDTESRIDNNNVNERDTEHFWGWGMFKLNYLKLLLMFESHYQVTKK